jgi:uncharacterized protein (DUF1684 family)
MIPLAAHRAARLAALQAEDGWLNLIARLPILPGPQTVGAGAGAALPLPHGPDHLGTLIEAGGSYSLQTPTGSHPFQTTPDTPPQLRVPPYLLEIHTADDQPALRVRDLTLPRACTLHHFPTDPAWIIRADWHALATPQAQAIGQKGGRATTVVLTHTAQFTHDGQAVTLLATHWKSGKPMFVFRDATSGRETYAASRFLIGEDATDTQITLDFNRAFTPPCGFTDFAICPLPPRENILPFAIRAGELRPGGPISDPGGMGNNPDPAFPAASQSKMHAG